MTYNLELDKAIKEALSSKVATVIDIPIDPEVHLHAHFD